MSFAAPPGERGAALLAVLLLVAAMAAISVVALEKLRLATSLAANAAALDQARAFAFGAEALALTRVGLLDGRATGATTLAGGWNGRVTRLPVPNGIVSLTLRDGGNCFNLNSVAQGGGPAATPLTDRPEGIAQFVALMRLLGIADPDARRVAAGLADWIDADATPLPGGAEDDDYLRAPKPYRAANTLLAEVSELRAVSGVTGDIYRVLRPWVCAPPTTDLAAINVNTLRPEQAVLIALPAPRADVARVAQVLANRPAAGWDSIAAFWAEPGLAGLAGADMVARLGLRTRWFALDLDVEYAGAQVTETALIDAAQAPARLSARRWGSDE